MKLLFSLTQDGVRIVLEGKESVQLDDLRSLSQTLLPAVNKLLEKHHVSVDDLESIKMQSAIAPVFTSYRIVEATVRSLQLRI